MAHSRVAAQTVGRLCRAHPRALLLIVCVSLLGQVDANANESLDGFWFSDAHRYAFRISGNEGVAEISNSSRYSVGQVMFKFRFASDGSFVGEQIFTDGLWYPVTGRRVDPDTIELSGGGFTWRMVRRTLQH